MSMFEVGQEVTYQPYGRREGVQYPATITKIGRKYAYATVHGRSAAFDKNDGRGASDFVGRLVTPNILAAEEARASAFKRVHSLRAGWGEWDRLTTGQINRIADIIEEKQ